jgi:hypothetical protein
MTAILPVRRTMTEPDLHCFYILSSPWAYFAGPQLQDIVRRHRVPIEAAQRTMSKSKSRRYQAPDRASMWAALDPTPPSPTTRTDALVIRSMPSLAGDDDDE